MDILVNNVGYFEVKEFADISDREWTDMFELNVMSGVRLARALLPGMLERNWGRIVFIASEQSAKPNPGMAHYAMSKAAQVSIARSLAELTKGTRSPSTARSSRLRGRKASKRSCQDRPRAGKTVDEMRTAYFETPAFRRCFSAGRAAGDRGSDRVPLSERASAINGAAQRVDGGIVRSLF